MSNMIILMTNFQKSLSAGSSSPLNLWCWWSVI